MPRPFSRRHFMTSVASGALLSAAGCSTVGRRYPPPFDVVVLGAGLAGLNAAMHLEASGARVLVLEAASRLGGRVLTLDDVPGTPESGGTQISYAYKRVVDAATQLGLTLAPNGRSPLLAEDAMNYFINGRRMTRAQWIAASVNPFADAQRGVPPDRLLGRLIGTSPLASVAAWRDPANSPYDISLGAHLRSKGFSDEALRLVEINNSYGDSLDETSLLSLYHVQTNTTELLKTPGPIVSVVGGNQRLPEAMAKSLKQMVMTNQRVVAVDAEQNSMRIRCADGSTYFAAKVICALPLPAMRNIAFSPTLPTTLAEAVSAVPYARVTQLHLAVERNFWKDEGASPYIWSDGALERVFPSDPTGSGNPQTLTCWINGRETARWDRLNDDEAGALAVAEMKRIFPASEGALRLARRVTWHASPLAGGAWANWRPGQITRLAAAVALPSGRLHFAGEHCGSGFRGLEAAMESGARAARAVIADG
jgi:monoamine oxidase